MELECSKGKKVLTSVSVGFLLLSERSKRWFITRQWPLVPGSRFLSTFPQSASLCPPTYPVPAKAPLLTDVGISSVVSMLSPGALRARRTGPAGR